MPSCAQIKGYFVASFCSVSRIIYSAGQSFFANKHAAEYCFRSRHPSTIALPIIAVVGSVGSNLIARIPLISKQFLPEPPPIPEDHSEIDTTSFGPSGKCVNVLLQTSCHLSGVFNALLAHFGAISLAEALFKIKSNTHRAVWKEALLQALGLQMAVAALATYYAFEFKLLKNNAVLMADRVNRRALPFDKNTVKTLAVCTFTLLATPIIAKFWTAPALLKIPYLEKILKKTGINAITWTASISSFTTGLTILPSVYAYFDEPAIENENSTLAKSIRYSVYFVGGVDSLASGLCAFVAVVDTAKVLFNLNPYGIIIAFAIPCAIGAAAQNAMFSIRPGYMDLLQTVKTCQPDEELELQIITIDNTDQQKFFSDNNIDKLFKKTENDLREEEIELESNPTFVIE